MARDLGTLSRRHVATLLHLLRYHADQERRMHGPLRDTPGSFQLTPTEMEVWADAIESEYAPLDENGNTVLGNPSEGWLDV